MAFRIIPVIALVASAGCAGTPFAPSETGGGQPTGGGSVTIMAATPANGEMIDYRSFARVSVSYAVDSVGRDLRVWICVGQTATSVILSSCTDAPVGSLSGNVERSPVIFWINKQRAVRETRYIAVFLTEGDIVERRVTYPPVEMGFDKLTHHMLARDTREHFWKWGDLP
jgi:hypothetical protein